MAIKVMVDVDSTLYDAAPIVRECAEAFGVVWPEINDRWTTPESLNATTDQFRNMFELMHGAEVVARVKPYDYAADQLSELVYDYQLDLWYASNRSPELDHVLVRWLTVNSFPNPSKTHTSWDKHEWIATEKPDIVVDDRIKTILHALKVGCRVFSIEQPWNCNLHDSEVSLYPDWLTLSQGIRDYLEEIKVSR